MIHNYLSHVNMWLLELNVRMRILPYKGMQAGSYLTIFALHYWPKIFVSVLGFSR